MLDGEGVICGADGKSDFDRMRACFSPQGAPEAFLYAVDVPEINGRDLCTEVWARRRAELVSLLDGGRGPGLCN
jgi:ATP-dependent DNA ligase